MTPWKMALLRRAFATYQRAASAAGCGAEFEAFRAEQREWLEDYALFAALNEAEPGTPWTEWEPGLARREPKALAAARARLARGG